MGELDDLLSASDAARVEAAPAEPPPWETNEKVGGHVEVPTVTQAAQIPEPPAVIPVEVVQTAPVEVSEPERETPAPVVEPAKPYRAEVRTDPSTGLAHYLDVEQFQIDVSVNESNLDTSMMQQAGMRAFYNSQAAYAESQYDRSKAAFEVIEARLYDHHRKELAASGEKTTDKAIEAAVRLDPRWLKARTRVIEAQTIANVNKGLTFAMSDRRDMLIQLGSDRREEFKGGLRILEGTNEAKSLSERARASAKRVADRQAG